MLPALSRINTKYGIFYLEAAHRQFTLIEMELNKWPIQTYILYDRNGAIAVFKLKRLK